MNYLLIHIGRYKVIFFGTHQTGTLKAERMAPYNPVTKAKFVSRNLQKLGFREAMAQIENTPEIIALEGVGVLEAVAKEGGGDGEEVPEAVTVEREEKEVKGPDIVAEEGGGDGDKVPEAGKMPGKNAG